MNPATPPEPLEALGVRCGVTDRVLNLFVTHVVLNPNRCRNLGWRAGAARMPEHGADEPRLRIGTAALQAPAPPHGDAYRRAVHELLPLRVGTPGTGGCL